MSKAIRVLIIEDSEDDALLLLRELRRGGYEPSYERMDTPEAMGEALARQRWDIVIADYVMPRFSGLDALKLLQKSGIDLPFIIVSGKIGEDIAVEAMKAGANDYIAKGKLARLIPAIEREIREWVIRREHKRDEEQIEKQREFLKNIFESLTHPFYVINASDHAIMMANPAASMGKIIAGSKCYMFIHGREMPCSGEYLCPLEEVKKTKQPVIVEHVHRDIDGNARDVEVHGFPIFESEGNVEQMIEYCLDITERKRAEEKLKLTMDDLTQSNKELELFSNLAAQDLQEPLHMVTKYLQLLESEYKRKANHNTNDYIDFAAYGVRRLQNMVDHMLQYSRINTRGRSFEITDCNIVLDSVLTDLKVNLDESNAIITHDPLPVVFGDPSQLGILFQNLIGNAIKFRGDNPPRIHINFEKKESEFLFSVKDNGIGFDMRQADRLFKMFQRLHGEKYQGIGMGLAICKKIVERHGGRIWAESKVGGGSTFFFTIQMLGSGKS